MKIVVAVISAGVLVLAALSALFGLGMWLSSRPSTHTENLSADEGAELLALTQSEVSGIVDRAGLRVVSFDPAQKAKISEKVTDTWEGEMPEAAVVRTGVTTGNAEGDALVHRAVVVKLTWSSDWAITSCRIEPPP